MYAFLVLLFPIALFRHLVREGNRAEDTAAWVGAAISIILCTFKAFLTFSHRIPSALFASEWVYSFVSLTIVPILCSCVVLFIVKLRGARAASCVCALFSALASFYAVYLPFLTLAGSRSSYSSYELFFRPPLYLMMITSIALCAKLIAAAHIDRSLHLRRMGYPMLSFFALIPSAVDAMWFTNEGNWIVLWGVYLVLSFFWYVICASRSMK